VEFLERAKHNENSCFSFKFKCVDTYGEMQTIEVDATYLDGELTVDTSTDDGEAYAPDAEAIDRIAYKVTDLLSWFEHALTTTLDAL
jgi:hypothetical protein